jgi:hypothetical protein
MMMEMFGGAFMLMLLAYSIIPLFPFVYVILRWRQAREGEPPDPQLGLKVALHYFATIGWHVTLIALFIVLYSFVVDSSRTQEVMLRMGAGLLLGGVTVYGLHRVLIARMTDSAERPNVVRVFRGLNLVLCGLIGMSALIAVCAMITQESVPEEPFKIAGLLMLVYLTAWAAQARGLAAMVAAKPAS